MDIVEIPYRELSADALYGILEEYATRGGFESDLPVGQRVSQLRARLEAGKLKIVFDPEQGLANLTPAGGSSI